MINGKYEYVDQVHIRFGFYETSVQQDNLPANLFLSVNTKPAQLPVNIFEIYLI